MILLHIVIDLQFGSTGKGALAGLLGQYLRPDAALAAWGPNAGHTNYDVEGIKHVHTMVPNSLTTGVRLGLIGPGAAINVRALEEELDQPQLRGCQLIIHPNATIVNESHRDQERELVRVGSTMKGTSAALIDKIKRDPVNNPLAGKFFNSTDIIDRANGAGLLSKFNGFDARPLVTVDEDRYMTAIDSSVTGLLEGAQGYSLGYHTQFWPHVTSRDISPYQMMADCRIPVMRAPFIWGTCRTYPIRVADRFVRGDDGQLMCVGTSGGCYRDQAEIKWEQIGRVPELTTVTKLPRRLFTFSDLQLADSCRVARPDAIMLTFCDYVCERPEYGGPLPPELRPYLTRINAAARLSDAVRLLAWGPTMDDVFWYDYRFNRCLRPAPILFARLMAEHGAAGI